MKLREIQKSDCAFINRVRNHESTRSVLSNTSEFTLEQTEAWFDATDPKWYIIVNDDNENVGYIRTDDDTKTSVQIGADVDPNHRRRGYARWGYDEFFQRLKDQGYDNVHTEVLTTNEAALATYKSIGFEVERTLINGTPPREVYNMVLQLKDFSKRK